MEMRRISWLLLVLFLAGCFMQFEASADDYNFRKPVRIKAAGEVIDTGEHVAHSGPAFADLNGDGVIDLLVGNFRGYIEYFENKGTNEQPEYAEGKMLEAEGETIKVHNW